MFLKNAVFKLSSYIIITAITIISVPIIIDGIGLEAFGFIGVTNSIIAYVGIVTVSFTSCLSRNIIFSLKNSEGSKASLELNSSLIGIMAISLLLVPIVIIISNDLLKWMDIPEEIFNSAVLLFQVTIISFTINSLSGVFGSCFIIKNRLDLQSISDFINKFSLNSIAILLILYYEPSLNSYTSAIIISSLLFFVFNFISFSKLIPGLKVNVRHFSLTTISNNMSTSIWLIINQIGALLYSHTGLIIINKFIGTKEAGIYSIILIISNQIRGLGYLMTSLFQPKLMNIIASNDNEKSNQYLLLSILSINIFVSIISGTYIGGCEWVINNWLNKIDTRVVELSIVSSVYLPFTICMSPCWTYLMSHLNVKRAGIVTLIFGIINVTISVLLVLYTSLEMYSVILSSMFLLVIQNIVIIPMMLRKYNVKIFDIYKILFTGAILLLYVILVTRLVFSYIDPRSLIMLLASLCNSFLIVILSLYLMISLKTREINIIPILKRKVSN